MNPALRIAPVAVAWLASSVAGWAQSAPLKGLPGYGPPKRGGFVITVDNGEGERKSVTYDEGEKKPRPAPAPGVLPPALPAPAPAQKPATTAADTGVADANGVKRHEIEDVDPAVSRFTGKEENLATRRFFRDDNEAFTKDEKFDKRDPVSYGKWGRGDESYERETAGAFSSSERFATERIDKESIVYERRDREMFPRTRELAEIPSWTERFSRDRNDKFSDRENGSKLREKFADGYKLLTQVSMQDINRNNFRRNHSDEKGGLPVGKIGAEGAAPMKPAKE